MDAPLAGVAGLVPLDERAAIAELARYRERCLTPDRTSLVVGHLVPPELPAHCRVLPPIPVQVGGPTGQQAAWRWADVLAGVSVQPGGLAPALRGVASLLAAKGVETNPQIGAVSPDTMRLVVSHLASGAEGETACFYSFWSGRAIVGGTKDRVYTAPLSAAARLYPLPELYGPGNRILVYECPTTMWATDLSWALAIHTDAVAMYIGGPADLIDSLVADPDLEADTTTPGTPVDDWTTPGDVSGGSGGPGRT
ncbi:MAG: hypothetical protein QOE45_1370 [Frankiaceae bacterium]|nr:hypothetical protein [Frankiaceae bacterium]